MAANANLNGLSRRHGVKVGAGSVLSVEEVALAVGQEIGHSAVKSAARMNRAVVLFVENVDQANRLVETGITVGGQFVQVTPLTQPAARITLSNVPPFIGDEFLERELSRHGKLLSPIRKLLSVLGGLGETGDGMNEISELGEPGEMGDMGETGEQGVAVGDVGQETGERGAPGKIAGELGVGGMTTAPAKRRRKQKNVMNDGGDRKAGRLEDAAAATDTSDQEYMSNASELPNTVADSKRNDLYPPSMIKNFLTKTKGMRGPDLGIYFPDKLQSGGH
ncbi:hypothetical protein D4764_15G0011080 [Takifugu flavidus]|uniref:Uncharacterized protein n=1 Tax=Takifugu flavidus TaxID=433684 RepID=A0A5C6P1Q0_9TELE|nr:hypothetical protein D4764_15G0011080 [Takifugu flavidus]